MPTMALSGQIRWNFFRDCDLIENGPFYADHAPRLRARWREFDHLAFRERMRRSLPGTAQLHRVRPSFVLTDLKMFALLRF
jgi:hypothetical protein